MVLPVQMELVVPYSLITQPRGLKAPLLYGHAIIKTSLFIQRTLKMMGPAFKNEYDMDWSNQVGWVLGNYQEIRTPVTLI